MTLQLNQTSSWSRRQLLQRGAGVAGLAALAPVLAACGDDDDADTDTTATGGKATGPIDVLRWDPIGGVGVAFTAAARGFATANPGAKVTFQKAPIATYSAALTSQIRSGTLPDLVMLLAAQTNSQAWPAVEAMSKSDVGDVYDQLAGWESAAIIPGPADQFFGIPLGTTGALWYYNKAAYEKAGLDPDSPPETWEAFTEACDRLKAKGIAPIGMGAKDNYTALFAWQSLQPQFYPSAEEVAQFATGELKPNDAGMKESLGVLRETYTSGWWQEGFAGKAATDVQADFMAGKVGHTAGIVSGLLDWATFDTQMSNGSYGAFAAPVIPQAPAGDRRMHQGAVEVLAVNSKSDNAETARAFAEYLVSKETQELLLKRGGQLPNRKDVDAGKLIKSQGGQAVAELYATLPGTSTPVNMLKAPALAVIQQKLTVSIVDDQIDDLLDQATKAQETS